MRKRIAPFVVFLYLLLWLPAVALGAEEGTFSLTAADAVLAEGGFEDIRATTEVALLPESEVPTSVGQLSGEVVGGFVLSGNAKLSDAEIALSAGSAAGDSDVLALYRQLGDAWQLTTYAEVVEGSFAFQTSHMGIDEGDLSTGVTFAVVNKARGSVTPTTITASASAETNKNSFRAALATPGVYAATDELTMQGCYIRYDYNMGTAEVVNTRIKAADLSSTIRVENFNQERDGVALYFSNCTFDGVCFSFKHGGCYVFDNCTFVNSYCNSIEATGAGVRVYVFNCNMHDNAPPLDEFNANASSERSWKYAALSARSDDVSFTVCRTTIQNYQTNSTILVEKGSNATGHTGVALYVDHCTIDSCGGCGISLNSSVRGRVSHNTFSHIGAMRGENGYAVSENARWGYPSSVGTGKGVGGNAVYGNKPCYQMRVSSNTITHVMENAIEGYYWCVDDNIIDHTGYRFDEGFDTVSTEAIWGGSAFVRNNTISYAHGHGIMVNASNQTSDRPFDIPFDVVVCGNKVYKNDYGLLDDHDGIRIAAKNYTHSITIRDNEVSGFRRALFTIGDLDNVTYDNNAEAVPPLTLDFVETREDGKEFVDVTSGVQLTREGTPGASSFAGRTGASVASFSLSSSCDLGYTEIRLRCDQSLARAGEVVELFQMSPSWQMTPYGYYVVVEGGTVTFEVLSKNDLGRFVLFNRSERMGTRPVGLNTLAGSTDLARLRSALREGGPYTADGATLEVSHLVMNGEGQYKSPFELRDATLAYNDPANDRGFNFNYDGPNDFFFENCTFDGLGFTFSQPGTYAFVNCTFRNLPKNALAAQTNDVRLFMYGCTVEANAPDRDTWNQNKSGDRHSNYAVVRMRGHGDALHAADCRFRDQQTDSTFIVQSNGGPYENVMMVFERNEVVNCGGAGLVFDNVACGRVEHNAFRQIGGTRGQNGYKSTIDPTLGEEVDGKGAPGAGVGGNALFARGKSLSMRVRYNDIKDVMENGIEGCYYCISSNTIDTTGYRYNDTSGDSYNGGYKTVSTQGISADGTWYVTDNKVLNVHGRGITVSLWDNLHPLLIANNEVSRRADGYPDDGASEGIKVRTDAQSWQDVHVENNRLSGFLNNYRVIHANGNRICDNVTIHDINPGKLMGDVYTNYRGVKLTTERDVELPFVNGSTDSWQAKRTTSFTAETDTTSGAHYLRLVPKDYGGRISQTFELPDRTCVVCLEIVARASNGKVRAYVASRPEVGAPAYESEDGGSYNEFKAELDNLSDTEFTTRYVCLKARGLTELGLMVSEAEQTLDVVSVRGWYAVDSTAEPEPQVTLVTVEGITARDKTYDGTRSAELDCTTAKVMAHGTIVEGLGVAATGTFASTDVGEGTVTLSDLALTGDDDHRYALAEEGQQQTTTARITPLTVGLEWGSAEFVYDGTKHVPAATATGLVAGDTCEVSVAGARTDAGTYAGADAARVQGLSNDNYCLPAEGTTKDFYIAKAMTVVGEVTAEQVTDGRAGSGVVLHRSDESIAGKLSLVESTLEPGTKVYHWRFEPEDTNNYEVAKGEVTIAVQRNQDKQEPDTTQQTPATCGDSDASGLGHDWDDGTVTVSPTCEDAGVRTFVCRRDASHTKTEAIPALGHDWGNWEVVTPATEMEEGTWQRTCLRDANHTETKTVPDLGAAHDSVIYHVAKAPDAWQQGVSTDPLTFIIERVGENDATFSHFQSVCVDGKTLDEANYDATPGSVDVSLKPAYLATLSIGSHVLTAVFDDDSVDVPFVIAAQQEKSASNEVATDNPPNKPSDSNSKPAQSKGAQAPSGSDKRMEIPATNDATPSWLPLALLVAGLTVLPLSSRIRHHTHDGAMRQ